MKKKNRSSSQNPEKIILDCDPGIDDGIAIITALKSSSVDLKGITTVSGSDSVSMSTRNACRILDFMGVSEDFPVVKGSSKPLYASRKDSGGFHGRDGLGDSELLPGTSKRKISSNVVRFILDSINEMNVRTIVTTGPLTNIAKAIKKEPKTMNKLRRLVIMGGAIRSAGNIERMSEFNFYADPDAADYVINKFRKEKILFPLDITNKVIHTRRDINKFSNNKSGRLAKSILGNYLQRHLDLGYGGCPIHDALTLSYVIDPYAFKLRNMDVRVETKGKFTRGTCVPELRKRTVSNPNVKVAVETNKKRFIKYLKSIINK